MLDRIANSNARNIVLPFAVNRSQPTSADNNCLFLSSNPRDTSVNLATARSVESRVILV